MRPSPRIYKSLFRLKLTQSIAALGHGRRKQKSRRILKRLIRSSYFRKSRNLLTYVALSQEVETMPLIREALKRGKKVFVPHVDRQRKTMRAYRIEKPGRQLKPGSYGILEPVAGLHEQPPAGIDLVIIPGLGFDRSGVRLGRGMGYFDRFLKCTGRAKKIGLAFREQVLNEIPSEAHDVPMDLVITD
jgi:5-formyltetrahydrofolate cyclo-ligase